MIMVYYSIGKLNYSIDPDIRRNFLLIDFYLHSCSFSIINQSFNSVNFYIAIVVSFTVNHSFNGTSVKENKKLLFLARLLCMPLCKGVFLKKTKNNFAYTPNTYIRT